jgi:hypothetical protein
MRQLGINIFLSGVVENGIWHLGANPLHQPVSSHVLELGVEISSPSASHEYLTESPTE